MTTSPVTTPGWGFATLRDHLDRTKHSYSVHYDKDVMTSLRSHSKIWLTVSCWAEFDVNGYVVATTWGHAPVSAAEFRSHIGMG